MRVSVQEVSERFILICLLHPVRGATWGPERELGQSPGIMGHGQNNA